MTIEVSVSCDGWLAACPDAAELAATAARAALAKTVGSRASVSHIADVVLTDDAEQQRLNRTYRGVDAATNVLAFALADDERAGLHPNPPPHVGEGENKAPVLLGDVVLALETVAREAAEQGKPIEDHLRHLVVHGVLHLLGFDHQGEAEAVAMEARETAILEGLGVPDPYRDTI